MKNNPRVGIIGCGLIGKKRVLALKSLPFEVDVTFLCDVDPKKTEEVEKNYGKPVKRFTDSSLALMEEVDIVVVATFNSQLAPLVAAALKGGKHVLVEKPAGMNADEVARFAEIGGKGLVRIGYNHRYHPAFLKIRELLKMEDAGKLMFIRARYGHGGRIGYENEWRSNRKHSGGGELIDQGVHLIDLANVFMGDVAGVRGSLHTYFWNMEVEDNAFVEMRDTNGATAWLHASCTEWKNTFSFEAYFEKVKFLFDGLGGSYGKEKLTFYKMLPQMGPPEATVFEFPDDTSWVAEWAEFFEDIKLSRTPNPGIKEGVKALKVVDSLYNSKDWI